MRRIARQCCSAGGCYPPPLDNPKLALVEAICISYFSIEYLLRLAGAPQKLDFIKGTMNVIDCMAIAPYYLTLFFVPPPVMMREEPLPDTQQTVSSMTRSALCWVSVSFLTLLCRPLAHVGCPVDCPCRGCLPLVSGTSP